MKNNVQIYNTPDWILAFTTGRDASIEDLGLKMEDLGLPRQTHSDHVMWICKAGRPEDTDAVISDTPGLCICVKTADCIPILIYDSNKRIVAAIHAGWRGTVSKIVSKTIEKMNSLPENLHAIIGPGISLQAFEVGNEVYEAFHEAGFPMERISKKYQKWHIDLWEANRWLLEENGIQDIFIAGQCTYNNLDKFYSARRETINTGRNFNGIMIRS